MEREKLTIVNNTDFYIDVHVVETDGGYKILNIYQGERISKPKKKAKKAKK